MNSKTSKLFLATLFWPNGNSKFSKEDEAVPEDDTRSNEVLVLFRVGGSVGLLIKLPRGSVFKKRTQCFYYF